MKEEKTMQELYEAHLKARQHYQKHIAYLIETHQLVVDI